MRILKILFRSLFAGCVTRILLFIIVLSFSLAWFCNHIGLELPMFAGITGVMLIPFSIIYVINVFRGLTK